MKKNKKIQLTFEDDKFEIPQISFPLDGLIRGKGSFQPSPSLSAIHGTHAQDRHHVVDNSKRVNVDTTYDFVREKSEKHISEEELIRKYGTKYPEFSFIDKQLTEDEVGSFDYSKTKKEEIKKIARTNNTLNSFFEDAIEPEIPEEPKVFEPEPVKEPDILNPNERFEIKLPIDDDSEPFTYNTYDSHLPTPEQETIPSYLRSNIEERPKRETYNETVKVSEPEEKIEDLSYPDESVNIDFNEEPEQPAQIVEDIHIAEAEVKHEQPKPVAEKPKYENYSIPYKKLFPTSGSASDDLPEWLEEKKEIINNQLQAFGIDGEVITYTKGPAFTRYEIMLAQNVNVKKINSIYDNIQMALEATSLRIQAPIPGKNTVGIEVPNKVADVVKFGDILTDEYIESKKNLSIAMGKNIDGTPVFQNIIDMPHALIAGATKSGKSVCINTLLVSLLIKNSPEQLKLILVDPKMVELAFYNDLPHLATPVINDPFIATEALKWAVDEMERRYELLAQARVRNIEDYNRKRLERPDLKNLPFIVIVVDEFNDLIMQCQEEANNAIVRLAQKARAAGIHIILATQRPTVNVVSGTIKANITCRIAFRVSSDGDSRIILDEQGAESLLGRGDMLIKNNGQPERVQGAYISDEEIGAICDYICDHYKPDFLFTHEDLKKKASSRGGSSVGGKDAINESEELIYQIALDCVMNDSCSINSIQTKFGLGFNRASRIVAILEERGIVAQRSGTKREILVDTIQLKQKFDDLFSE